MACDFIKENIGSVTITYLNVHHFIVLISLYSLIDKLIHCQNLQSMLCQTRIYYT